MRSVVIGGLVALASGWATIAAQAQTQPTAVQAERPGHLSADLGASVIEIGATREGVSTYVAHGYAAAETKEPDVSDPSKAPGATLNGEFAFRIGNLCVSSASAQIVPVGLIGLSEVSNSPENAAFLTGVKVEAEERPKGTCTYVLHVSYGAKLPKKAKLTQIAYTVFVTGTTRTPDSKPVVLPLTPL